MLQDLASMAFSTTHSIVKADSKVADEVISMVKQMMNKGQAIYSHDDPMANARISTNGVAVLDTYPPSDNTYVVENEHEVQSVKDMQKCFALRAGIKNDTGSPRLCTSMAMSGLIAAGSSENKFSPSPLIFDVIPCHSEEKFDTKTSIPAKINRENIHIAKHIIRHCLESCKSVWISGADLQKTLFAVVQEMGLIMMYLSDAKINEIAKDYSQPRARYDFEEHYPVVLLHNKKTKHTTVVFTCFQIGSTIAGPTTINRPSGKILISFVHELVCGFLDISGAKNRKAVVPNFTKAEDSIIHQALTTKGANKVTEILQDWGLVNESMKYMYSCVVGGIKSNATDPGRDKGVHYSNQLQRDTMSSFERGEVGGIESQATDPGQDKGVHYSNQLQRDTMSSFERGELVAKASQATDPGRDKGVHYSTRLQRDTMSSFERGELFAKASNATDPGRDKGVHYSTRLQRDTMSSFERGELFAKASNATDPGRDKGVHYSTRLQQDIMSSFERGEVGGIESNATDPGRDKGVHYSNQLQRDIMLSSECGKLLLGVAKKKVHGSIPAWIMIESANTPTTFEPRCSNVRNSLICLLMSVGAIKREKIRTAERWMKDWVEKAKSNTGPEKCHTFSCRDDPHKRKWKLTIYPEGEQQPSGVKEVDRSILDSSQC